MMLRRPLIVVGVWLFGLSGAGIVSSAPAAGVTVRCSQPQLVAGQRLRVVASDALQDELLLPIDNLPSFDASGEATVDLAPGMYSFEVAAVRNDDTIVVLRSNAISVPKATSAKLIAGEPQSLTLTHEGGEVELTEVAVRSAIVVDVRSGASTGEVRWHRKATTVSPKLILTPGKSTRITLIGHAGPVYVAAWEKLTPDARGTPIRLRTQSQWSNCRFVQRAETPATRNVTGVLVFPDSRMEIPVTDATRVLTNRRFIMMGYRLETDDGKRWDFEPLPYTVNRLQRFEFGGGELTPRAWADYVSEDKADENGKKHRQHLYWRYELLDAGGHRLNTRAAGRGVSGTAWRLDGRPLPKGAIDAQEQAAVGDPRRAIRVRVEWTWNGLHSRELAPDRFMVLRSDHFQIKGVPAWFWASQRYLSMLERLYAIERGATGRRGPALVRIRWRKDGGGLASVGRRGGGQTLGCALPFRGYERSGDPFDLTRNAPHEMLHTFGYQHGEEMYRLQSLVKREFSLYRWYIADHPEIVPPIVRGVPADAVERPPVKKKAGRKKKG